MLGVLETGGGWVVIRRILAWAVGVWSPSRVLAGKPPYHSFRSALLGRERDAWEPPRWALDDDSPAFGHTVDGHAVHRTFEEWRARHDPDACDCSLWRYTACSCKGACSCHWRAHG